MTDAAARPDLAELRALLDAATPGPWGTRVKLISYHEYPGQTGDCYGTELVIGRTAHYLPHRADPVVPSPYNGAGTTKPPAGYVSPDAALIVAMRNALPALLSEIERQGDDLGAAAEGLARKLIAAIDADDKPNIHGWSRALAAALTEGSR